MCYSVFDRENRWAERLETVAAQNTWIGGLRLQQRGGNIGQATRAGQVQRGGAGAHPVAGGPRAPSRHLAVQRCAAPHQRPHLPPPAIAWCFVAAVFGACVASRVGTETAGWQDGRMQGNSSKRQAQTVEALPLRVARCRAVSPAPFVAST